MDLSPNAPGVRVNLDVPSNFAGIPLTGDLEQLDAHIRKLAERRAETPAGTQSDDVASLWKFSRFLAQREILLFGRFTVEDDTTHGPILADLALAVPRLTDETPGAIRENRNAVAAKLVEQYKKRHPDAAAGVIPLTSGPALIAQRAIDYQLGPETGHSEGTMLSEFRAEFQIPSPDASCLVVMTITTNSEPGWPAVAAQATQIANSIRFEEVKTSDIETDAEK